MSLIHALIGRRGGRHFHHAHHHPYRGHGHGGGAHFHDTEGPSTSPGVEGRADWVAQLLNLDATQAQQLATLIDQLSALRSASLKGQALEDLAEVLANGELNRHTIQALVDRRLAHIQQSLPQAVNALGDFLDALDADQRHTVRVLLRMMAGRMAKRTPPSAEASAEQAP